MQEHLGCEENVVDEIKCLIRNQIFEGQKNKQIQEAFVSEMNHQLSITNFSVDANVEEVKEGIENKFSMENINEIFESKRVIFENATNYEDVIKVFNYKELSKAIDGKFGLQKGQYRQKVVNLLKRAGTTEVRQGILDSVRPYFPELP